MFGSKFITDSINRLQIHLLNESYPKIPETQHTIARNTMTRFGLLLPPVKRPQSSCWLFCHCLRRVSCAKKKEKKKKKKRKKRKKKKKKREFWITAVWRPLTQMCRWSWPQWLLGQVIPVSDGSRQEWVVLVLGSAVSVAAKTAGCVFVVDVGVLVGACS